MPPFFMIIFAASLSITCLFLPFAIATPLDFQALKAFIASADPSNLLSNQWSSTNFNVDPCAQNSTSWPFVQCSRSGDVTGLLLNGRNLSGSIPPQSLSQLLQLRVLRLDGNSLHGSIPSDLSNCTQLKELNLTNNQLLGPIPAPLSHRLRRIHLANNQLSQDIPSSLADIPGLLTLRLENNQLSGRVPAFNQTSLVDFNVSHNRLSGEIPSALSGLPADAFENNAGLCGAPFPACLTASSNTINRKKTAGVILPTVIASAVFLLVLAMGVLLCCCKRRTSPRTEEAKTHKKIVPEGSNVEFQSCISMPEKEEQPELVFFEVNDTFRLEDLLRASADLLGKGSLGAAYKAVMGDGRILTVKRLKELSNVGRTEFEQQMERVGKLRHPNVVPLWAYYYAKEEKLLVYEYQPNGNLFNLLHGARRGGSKPLPWKARLRIARGVADGLAFLHQASESQNFPHANLKSSNILIDRNFEARITDFGVAPLLKPTVAAFLMAGYKTPEYEATRKISQKSDVYSYGVLLLELLTGRMGDLSDVESGSCDTFNLPQWVTAVVRQEWTAEVFDRALVATNASEESLITMLQIAMACVAISPQQRPNMSQVLKMITSIKEDEFSASSASMSIERHARFGARPYTTSSDDSSMIIRDETPSYSLSK